MKRQILHGFQLGFSHEGSVFTSQTELTVGNKWFHKILHSTLCTAFQGLALLHNPHFSFYLSFRSVHALSQIVLYSILFSLFHKAWSQVCIYIADMHSSVIEVRHF
jgi:hypothetical protein